MSIAAAKAGIPAAIRVLSRTRLCLPVAVAALTAGLLAGCAAEQGQQASSTRSPISAIPLPERSLLKPQAEPACAIKTSRTDGGKDQEGSERTSTKVANLAGREPRSDAEPLASHAGRTLAQADPNAGLAARIKLEYERNCFRQAELRARQRLQQLQAAVGKTIRAVKRAERDAP